MTMTTYPNTYPHYTDAERKEARKDDYNRRIDELMEQRDRYQDFIAGVPSAAYVNNIETYRAELERMNAEIDNLIAERDGVDLAALAYGDYDLGARFTISGGEVMELDGHLEARYEEQTEEDMPF